MTRRRHTLTACALSLALAFGAVACGAPEEEIGVEEPAREGLAVDIGGLHYNVFITRQLNLAITPDKAYYEGLPAAPGDALYGIFIQVCNLGDEPIESADEFLVTDNQGNEFEPIELSEENAFAYLPRELARDECIPQDGSVAQLGPTGGSMLLYDFPLENTENRPLELEITSRATAEHEPETKRFELDL